MKFAPAVAKRTDAVIVARHQEIPVETLWKYSQPGTDRSRGLGQTSTRTDRSGRTRSGPPIRLGCLRKTQNGIALIGSTLTGERRYRKVADRSN